MWLWVGGLAAGYVLGSVPVGFVVVRLLRGVDLRTVGSGRTGGTNVMRAAGWPVALLCGVGDIAKAALAVLIVRALAGPIILQALTGVMAVLGHNYSIFLGLRGGAGTAPSMGGAAALWPWNAVILPLVLLARSARSGRTSLGSIAVAIALPVVTGVRAVLGAGPWAHVLHGVLTSVLTLWSLRPNICRLLRGEEKAVIST
jgi:glycerol-3-phosphate acyltransferase PlsY